jgi:hypothetical protein
MDENPILPAGFFFFFSTSSLPQNFPPSYLPPTSPRPTYHLPPPSYLPPTNPTPPHSIARAPETSGGCGAGAGAVELERNCWSWSGVAGVGAGPTRTRKGKKSSSFSCLLACCNAASSGARLRSLRCVALLQCSKLRSQAPKLALRCFVATQQALEPGSGACLLACLLAAACLLLQRSKLRSVRACCCNTANSGASCN